MSADWDISRIDDVISMPGDPEPLDWSPEEVDRPTAVDTLSYVWTHHASGAVVAYLLACCHLYLVAMSRLGLAEYQLMPAVTERDVPGVVRLVALAVVIAFGAGAWWVAHLDGLRYALGWAALGALGLVAVGAVVFFPALAQNFTTWALCPLAIITMSRVLRSILAESGFGPERLRQAWFASLVWLTVATFILGAWLLAGPGGIIGHLVAGWSYVGLGGEWWWFVSMWARLTIVPALLYLLWQWVYTKASKW